MRPLNIWFPKEWPHRILNPGNKTYSGKYNKSREVQRRLRQREKSLQRSA